MSPGCVQVGASVEVLLAGFSPPEPGGGAQGRSLVAAL